MRLRTIGLAAGLSVTLITSANAQEFQPALELSTIQKATVRPEAAALQVGGGSGNFGGQDVHQTGIGVLLGNAGFGIGVSARKFFGGPIGIQASFAHYGFPGYSVNELQAAVLYRLADIEVSPSLILTPYLGGGISFPLDSGSGCDDIDDLEDDLEDIFDEDFDFGCDDNDLGAVILGGVEAFFEQVPALGVSGEFNYNTNNGLYFGGAGFLVRAHWYFN